MLVEVIRRKVLVRVIYLAGATLLTCSLLLRFGVEGGLVLTVISRCALVARLGVGGGRSRVKVNFTFHDFEGQDKVSSEASAFQQEDVEVTKTFLIWHVMKPSH